MVYAVDLIDIESRHTKWLIDGMKSDNIVVDNSFQRRYVWVNNDRISLVETILLGFSIPEIYLWQNQTDPETGETKYSIVDGQQRLGAILSYINDEFKLLKSGLENKDSDYANKFFSELLPEQKSFFWKYKFSVRFIKEELDRELIVKLFLRLNKTSTTLNPQELRNAKFNGKLLQLSDDISSLEFWTKYKIFNHSDLRRMQDIQFISTLLLFIRKGINEETSQNSINKLYDDYNEKYPEYYDDFKLFKSILSVIEELVSSKNYLTNILKTKAHLYTLYTLSYFLLKKVKKSHYSSISVKLEEFFEHYINNTNFSDKETNLLLLKYRELNKEGTQKKQNRISRLEILKSYLDTDSLAS